MGWHIKLVICVQLAYVSVCLTQLSQVHSWRSFNLQITLEDFKSTRYSIPPSQIKSMLMYNDKILFVTMREFEGISNYLAYLYLTDNSSSPLLRPYPMYTEQYLIDYPHIVRVDRCDRLWVLSGGTRIGLMVFDLIIGKYVRNKVLSRDYINTLEYTFDMIVDDFECDNEYIYISSANGIWTYSWEGDLWRHTSDINGPMILAPNGFVYYNVRYHTPMVYYISTSHLRDKSNKTDIRELVRSRNVIVNLALSALDAKSDVLYYFNIHDKRIHAIPCWTSERCSSNCQDEIVASIETIDDGVEYITLHGNGSLWVVTSSSDYDGKIFNYRLWSVPVKSTCVESNTNDTTNTTNINEITTPATSTMEQTSTLGSVYKNATVNIAVYSTAGTQNSNISQAVGGTKYMPYLLFSFTNTTFNFNLSNFTITNFTNYTKI